MAQAFVVTSVPWSVQDASCPPHLSRPVVPMTYPQMQGTVLPQMRGHRVGKTGGVASSRTSVVSSPSPVSSTEDCGLSKGSISQLQEFVQGTKIFPTPPNCPVLQWRYNTRPAGSSIEFSATCAFLLDGVPHHTVGAWRSNKKLAQRDAAERTLGLFVSRWASLITLDELAGAAHKDARPAHQSEVELAEKFCQRLSWGGPSFAWSHRWEGGQCQAFAEVGLLDVPHTFQGRKMSTLEEAYNDTARRLLWYVQCPGYEDMFEPDQDYVRGVAQEIPEPHPCWNKDEALRESEDWSLTERKTIVSKVQKRLEQVSSEAGKPVWYWSFERDMKDRGWPPLFRAHVTLAATDRSFSGTWQRGQREAQIQVCARVSQLLDSQAVK